jgi:hypothetical protein
MRSKSLIDRPGVNMSLIGEVTLEGGATRCLTGGRFLYQYELKEKIVCSRKLIAWKRFRSFVFS